MLGQPLPMVIPDVVGFKLTGKLREGATATDLVLTVTQMLRKKGVVNKFVEFYGEGLEELPLANRATIANMSPEYGATCGFFPVDEMTLAYLRTTNRGQAAKLVEAYAKKQGLWRSKKSPEPIFTDTLSLDLGDVEPSLAGPKRPQDRVPLSQAAQQFVANMEKEFDRKDDGKRVKCEGADYDLGHGDIVIAAITSCTNTSNPYVMLGAGLIARNAVKHGLKVKPWVKTSLAPGSQVVTEYLEASGLQKDLNKIGYNLVGYGCTSCIGNSGPLPDPVTKAINDADLVVCAVLSGNRNFEGRVNPLTRANYLASPMLVVVYALAGSMKIDITKDPIGIGKGGKPVYLKDIWPSNMEVQKLVDKFVTTKAFKKRYADVFKGDKFWRGIKTKPSLTYAWDDKSTYVRNPPYFDGMGKTPGALSNIAGRPPARPVRRFDHDRPHLARRLDQEGQPGRRLSGRARRRGQGLQPVRHAARQSRGDDARHLRQHPPQERDGAGHRGRLHPPLPDRPARADLRRGDALQEGAHAADPDRRQGIRHRQLARLGRQGRQPAGRQGRGVRDLRAHPSLEPGRHGRAAAAVQGRHDAQDAQPHRPRELRRRAASTAGSSPAWTCRSPSTAATAPARRSP